MQAHWVDTVLEAFDTVPGETKVWYGRKNAAISILRFHAKISRAIERPARKVRAAEVAFCTTRAVDCEAGEQKKRSNGDLLMYCVVVGLTLFLLLQ